MDLREETLKKTLTHGLAPFCECCCDEKGLNGETNHATEQFEFVFRSIGSEENSAWLYVKPCRNHIDNYQRARDIFKQVAPEDLPEALKHKSLHLSHAEKWEDLKRRDKKKK